MDRRPRPNRRGHRCVAHPRHSRGLPRRPPRPDRHTRRVHRLRVVAAPRSRTDEAAGIPVGLEPIVNQLIDTTDGAQAVLDAVPGLGISFDPSHLEVTTHDVTDAASRLGSGTIIAALKDATGNQDDFSFPALGTGDIDFVDMLRTLKSGGFHGDVVAEGAHRGHHPGCGDVTGADQRPLQGHRRSPASARWVVSAEEGCRMWCAPFSPIMIEGAWVLPLIRVGITAASMTRRPSRPRIRSCWSTTAVSDSPIVQVPTGW
jgi:xylose isomerase-like TIM barrel protein